MQYRVLKAHRGRYGLLHAGLVVHLPRGYAEALMRHASPLVEPYEGVAPLAPAGEPAAEVQAAGKPEAGGTLAVPPAAGQGKPSSSRLRAPRSRAKTLTTVAAEPE